MTANSTQSATKDSKLIIELKIDANGEVYRKATKLARKDTLEGKLLAQLYPGIHVARVSVPMELTPYEQSLVENRQACTPLHRRKAAPFGFRPTIARKALTPWAR